MLQRIVESINLLKLIINCCMSTLHLFILRIHGEPLFLCLKLVQLLGTSYLLKVFFGSLDSVTKVGYILDQVHVLIHDVEVVFFVQSLHLVQLVLELLVRVSQELSLCLELFLNILVHILLFPLAMLNIGIEVLVEC